MRGRGRGEVGEWACVMGIWAEVPFVLQYARRPKLEKPHGLALADISGISGIGVT